MKRILLLFLSVTTIAFGSVIGVTDPTLVPKSGDTLSWNQFPADYAAQSYTGGTTWNDLVVGQLAAGKGDIVVACKDPSTTAKCGWKSGGGITAGDSLLKTADGPNGDPLTLTFLHPTFGVGAYVQADNGAQFTARIQAFAGLNSVLDMTYSSDALGSPIYLGVSDTFAAITKVVYSLTSTGGFAIDTLYFQTTALQTLPLVGPPPVPQALGPLAAPEPGVASLLGLGLVFMGLRRRKRSVN